MILFIANLNTKFKYILQINIPETQSIEANISTTSLYKLQFKNASLRVDLIDLP